MRIFYKTFLLCAGILGLQGNSYAADCNPSTQICQLKVLIDQDISNFDGIKKILQIAPNLEQLHLRIKGDTNRTEMVALIKQIRTINSSLQLGFHPDNSTYSYESWKCSKPDWACVFSNSIDSMNKINQALLPIKGFEIFSIEQSYVEPADHDSVKLQKTCLNGVSNPNVCTVVAQPTVKYGNVSASCGGADLYDGSSTFDYGYPQMYNLYHDWKYNSSTNVFPKSIFPNAIQIEGQTYSLLDAINDEASFKNIIPNSLFTKPKPHGIISIYQPGMLTQPNAIDPSVAAQILATLIVEKFGNSHAVSSQYPCGPSANGVRYFTLSGESEFLGANGWTPPQLVIFFNALVLNLQNLGVTDANKIPFAIWGWDMMIHNL